MLEFDLEWEDAPSVRSPGLVRTWARIALRVDGHDAMRFWSATANSVRGGVYASALPLARWIAARWWNLLHGRISAPDVLRGARAARGHRPWFEKHALLLARDGMAYPDLTVYREDELVGLRWCADPHAITTPGRFLEEGFARVRLSVAEAALDRVVEAVLERVDGIDDEDVEELRSDWSAVRRSREDAAEAALCRRLAALGLDPYAPAGDDAIESALDFDDLNETTLSDLLSASAPTRLAGDLAKARSLLAALSPASPAAPASTPSVTVPDPSWEPMPYRSGYARAHALRDALAMDASGPILDLEDLVARTVGDFADLCLEGGDRHGVEAAVRRDGGCSVARGAHSAASDRFLLGRALHHWLFVGRAHAAPRLLTRANDWPQAASRAFAAELLAPAEALAARLGGTADWGATEELAREFQVDPRVIAHQLENHGLI